jgi:glycosyltransferase involved in cell wall biosynthesis
MQIVGIMQVQNEDLYLERAARNVLEFCDRLLIADNQSSDGTWRIVERLAAESPKVLGRRIKNPRESSRMIAEFAGTETWVFGVDGDEVYDPAGLQAFRKRLERGEFDSWWSVFGNVCNCVEVDAQGKTARGYMSPPCRSMTKLYNFHALRELDPDEPQRLHGRNHRFAEGYDAGKRLELNVRTPWEEAEFRCLHMCFLPRSSRDCTGAGRVNVTEKLNYRTQLRMLVSRILGRKTESQYKRDKYRRGELVTVDTRTFFQ